MQDVLNFTYYLSKPPDGQWGAIQPDGSWSGMVNELQQERADMGNVEQNSVFKKFSIIFESNNKLLMVCSCTHIAM